MAAIYPLLLTLIIILIIPNSTLAAYFITSYCSNSSSKYATKSSFPTNLKTLLNSLTTNAATNPTGFNTTSVGKSDTDDVVYGLFLCRGDQDRSGCRDCVDKAARDQPQKINCPRTKTGLLVYDRCIVRYDGKPIAGILDQHQYPKWSVFNPSNVTGDQKAFADLVEKTLSKLAAQAANSPVWTGKKYANEKVGLNGSKGYLYGMVQCTPDLSASDCNKCLVGVISRLNKVRQGGRVYCPSCTVRYEIYRFLTTPFNSTLNTSLNVAGNSLEKRRNHSSSTLLLIAIPILGATVLSLLCFKTWICLRKRKAMERYNVEIDVEIDEIRTAESLHFDLSTIRASTNNFSLNNKLGEGGFGEVYKGKLENGQEVAIKRLSKTSRQGVVEFRTEVVLVAKLQHKNLVKLLGFCVTSKEKILVYEYLPNSSLDKLLFDSTKNTVLDWQTRLDIMVGIARGLQYLHEDSRLKVIHRDLKTSNILLDEAMNPKISDFGLAKLFGADQTQGDTNKIAGTYGYMAPEYAITGHYSVKSDVYSFGVIMLEILSGQKNRFFGGVELEEALLHRAWRLWNWGKPLDLVDPTLSNNFPTEEVIKCIHIGLLCVQEDATERPKMTWVVAALSGQSIDLPAPMPPHFFRWSSYSDKLAESISEYSYTGGETITDIYPRE